MFKSFIGIRDDKKSTIVSDTSSSTCFPLSYACKDSSDIFNEVNLVLSDIRNCAYPYIYIESN